MTPSQEKALKNAQSYSSYKSHYMKDKNLVIDCETEHNDMKIPYTLVIGPRGGKQHLQFIDGKWKVM